MTAPTTVRERLQARIEKKRADLEELEARATELNQKEAQKVAHKIEQINSRIEALRDTVLRSGAEIEQLLTQVASMELDYQELTGVEYEPERNDNESN